MTEFLHSLFANIFNNNIIVATILIAMLPVIELRGAIPFAVNEVLWPSIALSNWEAFGWSFLGSSIVVPIIALIFLPIINWLKRTRMFNKLATSIENKVKSKTTNINDSAIKSAKFSKSYWKKMIAVFAFVAIPLPLTGVWTGTCIAVFIGLDYISTCTTVILGNFVAGLIVTLILLFFPWLNNWLLPIFLLIVAIVVLYEVIKNLIKKRGAQKETQK